MTAADKYYLKAKDLYTYEIEDALEALDYGLSCDDTHAGLLTLKGEIYFQYLKRFTAAAECFELALYHEPDFVRTYYLYIKMLTETDDVKAAEKLIARAFTIRGIDKPRIWHLEAMLYEKQGMYTIALNSMYNSKLHSQCKDCFAFYKAETKRMQKKSKKTKEAEGEIVATV